MTRWQGIFLDFYGTLASGDLHAVESICQRLIDDHVHNEKPMPIDCCELAKQWGHRYFAAVESTDGTNFRLLRQIEHDTLVETTHPLFGRIDALPYIELFNNYCAQPPLYEEVREVLDRLTLPVCIVSNADEREIRSAIRHVGLEFKFIVSSEFARSYKPSPKIFEKALELTGWSADRVLHVGDSIHSDVGGAHAAGLKAAWVNRAQRMSDIGMEEPDFTWDDLRPLLSLQ